jgi:predicted Zn-ribbon and HTH transcriptional regulator
LLGEISILPATIHDDGSIVFAPLDRLRHVLHVDYHSTCDARARVYRRDLLELLTDEPRSVSWLARELGLPRGDVEDDLRHALRSARAAGHEIHVIPARCRSCGFTFDGAKLSKPGKCPACRGTRLYEPQISLRRP